MLKSIVCTYPGFRTLPKGLKQMLVASENIFFSEVSGAAPLASSRGVKNDRNRLWQRLPKRFNTDQLSFGA